MEATYEGTDMERRLKLLLGACGGVALAVSSYRWLSSPTSDGRPRA
jgi:hypothetical protein